MCARAHKVEPHGLTPPVPPVLAEADVPARRSALRHAGVAPSVSSAGRPMGRASPSARRHPPKQETIRIPPRLYRRGFLRRRVKIYAYELYCKTFSAHF